MNILKKLLIFVTVSTCLSACAKKPTVPEDPYEKYNRAAFNFNIIVDMLIYRPPAVLYDHVAPTAVKTGVSNFFTNLDSVVSIPNDVFQGKINYTLIDITRFLVNTTIGIGGLFDVATRLDLPKHSNNFGNTLAFYSDNKKSPYLILPFLGPFTVRDAFSLPVDSATYIPTYLNPEAVTWSLYGLDLLNIRTILLPTDKLIAAAFDPYAFERDAFLQKRNQSVQKALTEGDYKYDRNQYLKDQQEDYQNKYIAYMKQLKKQQAKEPRV
jgi:phospholipid-binding lipoprotein MlaA